MSWEQVMDSGLSYYLLVTVLLCFSSFLNGMSTVSLRSGGAYGSHIAQNRGCKYIEFDLVSVHNGNEKRNCMRCNKLCKSVVCHIFTFLATQRKTSRQSITSRREEEHEFIWFKKKKKCVVIYKNKRGERSHRRRQFGIKTLRMKTWACNTRIL